MAQVSATVFIVDVQEVEMSVVLDHPLELGRKP